MPPDFLLPLFVLTLLANAILIAVAIRQMLRGQPDSDLRRRGDPPPNVRGSAVAPRPEPEPETGQPDESMKAELARDVLIRRMVLEAAAPAPATVRASWPAGRDGAARGDRATVPAAHAAPLAAGGPATTDAGVAAAPGADPGTHASPIPAPELEPEPGPAPRPKVGRGSAGKAAKSRAPGSGGAAARSTEPRRGRRRFSLPPLDDDHERVSRSIESFLGGVEPTADERQTGRAVAAPGGPTTVAIVVVDGLPVETASARMLRTRGVVGDGAEPDAVADALAMVERTLRGAARGTDVVTSGDRGRFQVVLASTGELAARAYLHRIRAAIEPRLEAVDRPLRLAVATATVLDEPLDAAVLRAEHRLLVALDVARSPRVEASLGHSDEAEEADESADDASAPRAAVD